MSWETLAETSDFLVIAGKDLELVTGKTRKALIKLISDHIQCEELEELEDHGMAELLSLQDKIAHLCSEAALKHKQTQDDKQKLRKEIETLQLQFAAKQKQNNKPENREIQTQSTHQNFAPAVWHKDFKISGQIGELGQKDRLTFSSLAHQIEHGLNKGVPELEIVDAVIRAIILGMQFRGESQSNSSYPQKNSPFPLSREECNQALQAAGLRSPEHQRNTTELSHSNP